MRHIRLIILITMAGLLGCGTTKWTDTSRTATEQLLISDAMDRAVAKLDFRAVAGKNVYLDSEPLRQTTDSAYLTSLLRQHMLAAGCVLKENREEADYVVEIRAGAVGTDRREVVVGTQGTQLNGVLPTGSMPPVLPDMPLATKTEQRAVTKIAVFAYNRKTGRPIWQSGVIPVESNAKNVWLLGVGPFERGPLFEGVKFAGNRLKLPLSPEERNRKLNGRLVSINEEAFFEEPEPPETPETPEKKEAEKRQLAEAPAASVSGEPGAAATAPPTATAASAQVAKASETAKADRGVVQAAHSAPIPAPAGQPAELAENPTTDCAPRELPATPDAQPAPRLLSPSPKVPLQSPILDLPWIDGPELPPCSTGESDGQPPWPGAQEPLFPPLILLGSPDAE